jgi:KDO2-lipid IV(A) lauroyltransferase
MNLSSFELQHAIAFLMKMTGLFSLNRSRLLGARLGRLAFYLDERHREIVLRNLALALDGKNPAANRKLARHVFENLGKVFFEIAWASRQSRRSLFEVIRVEGLTHLQNAYRKGRGVLFLTAHFGNWEILSIFPAMIPYPVNIVYRPLDFRPLDRFFIDLRSRFGGRLIPTSKSAARIMKSLRRGEIVALLMDQNVDWYEGVFVDFFGHLACTSKGMALVALKTEAPVVPIFMARTEKGFEVTILPEIEPRRSGDKIKDIETNTAQYNKAIETMVRRYPDQWFWVHQRWKTKPFHPWPREEGSSGPTAAASNHS